MHTWRSFECAYMENCGIRRSDRGAVRPLACEININFRELVMTKHERRRIIAVIFIGLFVILAAYCAGCAALQQPEPYQELAEQIQQVAANPILAAEPKAKLAL